MMLFRIMAPVKKLQRNVCPDVCSKKIPRSGDLILYAAEGHDEQVPDAGQEGAFVSLPLLYPSAYQPLPFRANAV
jgi:hypothetical protein